MGTRRDPIQAELAAFADPKFLLQLSSVHPWGQCHTVRAYRDTLKLLFLFLAGQKRKQVSDLELDDLQAEAVLAFLNHLESKRSNSAATRNCRLAAIRSFAQHLLRNDVTRAGQYGRILASGING